ncbi:uncharacterized protein LOC106804526 [Setaria italica]|uniref:uncharacterized protein LOC106804526 n=1 Tax=Setaria italica TaxID=4555 RepID=UPI0007199E53|nr:uncharacterized protein LOC106804526 [Setaria italica]
MLVKLGVVVDAMYQGYYVLDTFKYKPYEEMPTQEQVSNSYALSCLARLNKRICAAPSAMGINSSVNHELEAVLGNLKTIVANITEFVILLGGCNKMPKKPYDTYLYIDNCMFSRLVEKQEIINILLEDNSPHGAPVVVPVIGDYNVGKKSLVGHHLWAPLVILTTSSSSSLRHAGLPAPPAAPPLLASAAPGSRPRPPPDPPRRRPWHAHATPAPPRRLLILPDAPASDHIRPNRARASAPAAPASAGVRPIRPGRAGLRPHPPASAPSVPAAPPSAPAAPASTPAAPVSARGSSGRGSSGRTRLRPPDLRPRPHPRELWQWPHLAAPALAVGAPTAPAKKRR